MQEKCDVQQQKNVQIKVVGTGSTICPILSSFTLYESPVQGLSSHIALLGMVPTETLTTSKSIIQMH